MLEFRFAARQRRTIGALIASLSLAACGEDSPAGPSAPRPADLVGAYALALRDGSFCSPNYPEYRFILDIDEVAGDPIVSLVTASWHRELETGTAHQASGTFDLENGQIDLHLAYTDSAQYVTLEGELDEDLRFHGSFLAVGVNYTSECAGSFTGTPL